jgi:dipeptidyl aminopeptidase/acylaminoacyl peptidase
MRPIAYVLLMQILIAGQGLPQIKKSQTPFGTVYGVVTDDRGTPLAKVRIKIGQLETVTTDDGKFFIRDIPSGASTVDLTLQGYVNSQRTIKAKPGEAVRLELSMSKIAERKSTVRNLLGCEVTQLTKSGMSVSGSVSPDGQMLAVEVLNRGTLGWDIWLTSLKGEKKKILANTLEDESNPRWSPRGDAVVFSTYSYEERYRVWVKKVAPRSKSEFVDKGLTPSWSPDGAWVIYAKLDNQNNWHVWKKEPAGNKAFQITTGDSHEQYPSWGIIEGRQKIAFASTRGSKSKQFEIWMMNPDGSDQRQISTAGFNFVGPAISPDGKMIACWSLQRGRPNSVWIMRSDGTDLKKVVDDASNPQWIDLTALLIGAKISGRQQLWRTTIRDSK